MNFRPIVFALVFSSFASALPPVGAPETEVDSLLEVDVSFHADERGPVMLSIFPVLPTGDFSDTKGTNGGLATVGVGFGLEYNFPIPATPFGWVTGAGLLINPIDEKAAETILASQLPGTGSVTGGTWYNAPILTGLSVGGKLVPALGFRAQVQGGMVIVTQGNIEATYDNDSKVVLESETSLTPGFLLAGTILIQERLALGIRYFNTRKAKMEGTQKFPDGEYADMEGKISISALFLTLGVSF